MTCTKKNKGIILSLIGLVLVAGGVFTGYIVPREIENRLTSASKVCTKDDSSYESWRTNDATDDVPLYKYYYAMSIDDISKYTSGENPSVTETGPYVMRQFNTNMDPAFANSTVTYTTWTRYTFDENLSCKGCKLSDKVINMSPTYLKVLTAAGSESRLALSLSFADTASGCVCLVPNACTPTQIAGVLGRYNYTQPQQLAAYCSGKGKASLSVLNCLDTLGTYTHTTAACLTGTSGGVSGLIIKKTIREFMYGYPSWLGGAATVSKAAPAVSKYCAAQQTTCASVTVACSASATSSQCLAAKQGCALNTAACTSAKTTLTGITMYTAKVCAQLTAASSPAANLCKQCKQAGGYKGCVAPIPGYLSSQGGIELASKADAATAVATGLLKKNTEATGCGSTPAQELSMKNGVTSVPVWYGTATRTNPLNAMMSKSYATHKAEVAATCATAGQTSATCQQAVAALMKWQQAPVTGGQGTQVPPKGVAGLMNPIVPALKIPMLDENYSTQPEKTSYSVYISQGNRATDIHYEKQVNGPDGVTLNRFRPSRDLLTHTAVLGKLGVGTPYNGVQNMGYSNGFLAYVSRPYFLYGDTHLLKSVKMTNSAGKVVDYTIGGGQVSDDNYGTYIDIEPATGRTFSAHKRLMASFAVNKVDGAAGALTDIFTPSVKAEVITPQYWMDETATIPTDKAAQFNNVVLMNKLSVYGGVIGIGIIGVLFLVVGLVKLVSYAVNGNNKQMHQIKHRASTLTGKVYSSHFNPPRWTTLEEAEAARQGQQKDEVAIAVEEEGEMEKEKQEVVAPVV